MRAWLSGLARRVADHWRREWRGHLGTLVLLLVALVVVQVWQTRHTPRGPAPDAVLTLVNGATTTLDQWRAQHPGRAVALHFWADWCPICRAEEHSISRVSRDWPVLTLAMQSGDAAHVRAVLAQRQLAWTTGLDPRGEMAKRYGLSAVPVFVVIDAQGMLRSVSVGYTSEIGMRLRLWWAQRS